MPKWLFVVLVLIGVALLAIGAFQDFPVNIVLIVVGVAVSVIASLTYKKNKR